MKNFLSVAFILSLVSAGSAFAVSPTYSNPSVGNMNFYPMMQYQMEKQETLDFTNDSENYKQKREQKDAENEYRAGNKNFNPDYEKSTGFLRFRRSSKSMEFTKDENGNIIIQDSSK